MVRPINAVRIRVFTDPQGSHAVHARKAVEKTVSTVMNNVMNTKKTATDAKNAMLSVALNIKIIARNATKNEAIHVMNAAAKAVKTATQNTAKRAGMNAMKTTARAVINAAISTALSDPSLIAKIKKTSKRRCSKSFSQNYERHHRQNNANKSEDTHQDEKAAVAKNNKEAAKRLDTMKVNRTAPHVNQ